MVLLSSGLGTADLSQRSEPRSPFGESRRPHHWAPRVALAFCMKPLLCLLPHTAG